MTEKSAAFEATMNSKRFRQVEAENAFPTKYSDIKHQTYHLRWHLLTPPIDNMKSNLLAGWDTVKHDHFYNTSMNRHDRVRYLTTRIPFGTVAPAHERQQSINRPRG